MMHLDVQMRELVNAVIPRKHTSNSSDAQRAAGSFNRQLSTKLTASGGNPLVEVRRGDGSCTIYWSRSNVVKLLRATEPPLLVDRSGKAKCPSAISINDMPSDHMSALAVYCTPWIRSGYRARITYTMERMTGLVHSHSYMSLCQRKCRQLSQSVPQRHRNRIF